MYLNWFGAVLYELDFGKRNSLAFLGFFRVRVYDFVFVCLFRPRIAWHRGLT